MNSSELRRIWEVRIDAFKESKESIPKWCATQDIKVHQLRYWLRKLESVEFTPSQSTDWLSVEVDNDSDTVNRSMLVRVGNVTIEVKPGFDSALFTEVVRTLSTL